MVNGLMLFWGAIVTTRYGGLTRRESGLSEGLVALFVTTFVASRVGAWVRTRI